MASLLSLLTSFFKPRNIEFVGTKNLGFESLSVGIIPMNITLVLKNPNSFGVTLESFSFEIWCKTRKIGASLNSTAHEIEAEAEFEVPLQIDLFSVAVRELLRDDLLEIITEGSARLTLRIVGNAKLKKFGFHFETPFALDKEVTLDLNTLLKKIKL